jgi:hypothetical protein
MIIVFKLTIFNYSFVFLNRQFANCVNYKIKLKRINFERDAKRFIGYEYLGHWFTRSFICMGYMVIFSKVTDIKNRNFALILVSKSILIGIKVKVSPSTK